MNTDAATDKRFFVRHEGVNGDIFCNTFDSYDEACDFANSLWNAEIGECGVEQPCGE